MIEDVPGVPSASLMNRIRDLSRRIFNLSIGPGIRMDHTPTGRSLSLDRPDTVFNARLISGPAGGPYVFRRVYLKDGFWQDIVAADDPAVAYQANLQDVVIPRVVRMRDVGLPKEYRFFTPRVPTGGGGYVCGDHTLPENDLLLTMVNWIPKRCTWVPSGPDAGAYINCSGYYLVSLPPLPVPLHYLGVGVWRSDPFLVGYDIDPDPGYNGFRTEQRRPRYIEVLCVNDELVVRMYAYNILHDTAPTDPGINIVSEPPEGTAFCPIEGTADLNLLGGVGSPACSFTVPSTIGLSYCEWSLVSFNDPVCGIWRYNCTEHDQPVPDTESFESSEERFYLTNPAQEAGTLCVTVRSSGCEGAGPTIPASTVEVYDTDDVMVASGTTDSIGKICFDGLEVKPYRIEALAPSGCAGTAYSPPPCANTDVEVLICCGYFCVDVVGYAADDDPAGPGTPLPDVFVEIEGIEISTFPTDANGRFCAFLLSSQMTSLDADPTNCSIRQARINLTKAGWIDRCLTVDIPCGQTQAVAEANPSVIDMYSLKRADNVDRYMKVPSGLAGLCGDLGCDVAGWLDHGLIPASWLFQADYFDYGYSLGPPFGGFGFYSVLPGAITLTPVPVYVDTQRLDGVTPTTYSPFDSGHPLQRVEYKGSYTGTWTPRDDSTVFSTKGHIWLGEYGAAISLERSATNMDSSPEPTKAFTLPTFPESFNLGGVQALILMTPFSFNVCDFTGSDASVYITDAFGVGSDLRWLVRWTEA